MRKKWFLLLLAAAPLAHPQDWPHTGKYRLGTRYLFIKNYTGRDLQIEALSGGSAPPQHEAFVLKAGKDTTYSVSNNWTASRLWGRLDAGQTPPFSLVEFTLNSVMGLGKG